MTKDPFKEYLRESEPSKAKKGIHETTEYLERFLGNLLLNEENELNNRDLHIRELLNKKKVDIESVLSKKM